MKGLWVKDLLVLKKQKLAVVLMFILAICSLAIFGRIGIVVGMSVFLMVVSMVVLSALTVDQQNHGLMYLLTLPIKKRQYVVQKYVLLLLATICSTVVMTIIAVVFAAIADWEIGFSDIFTRVYSVGVAMLSILILTMQYQIKHGPEKAQVAMSIIGAIVAIAIGGVVALVKYTSFGEDIFNRIYTYYIEHGSLLILVFFTVAGAAVVSLSCAKSIKTIESMEIQ